VSDASNSVPIRANVFIESFSLNSGQSVALKENDIVAVVGPNNSGKSTLLRELSAHIFDPNQSPIVLRKTQTKTVGDVVDFMSTFKDLISEGPGATAETHVILQKPHIEIRWKNIDQIGLQELHRIFVHSLSTEDRLRIANPAPAWTAGSERPSSPIHFLYLKYELEEKVSAIFRKAFGTDLVVGRFASNQIPLHFGDRPALAEDINKNPFANAEAIRSLPYLHQQGDGIRSFAGVLLASFVGKQSMIFIDEPEAFLHPPQARLLGQTLAKEKPSNRQLFLSTHSGDFLRGLISSNPSNVRILRIQRGAEFNTINELSPEDIGKLWSDPLLRHSNALDGLFHERVIVCESDSDSRFYNAVMDAISENEDSSIPDAMFTHVGGKHRLHVIVRALIALGVSVHVAADFDVLNDEDVLKKIVESFGENWSMFERDWKILNAAMISNKTEKTIQEVKDEIGKVLAQVTDGKFPPSSSDEIRKILRQSSPWAIAKSAGKAYVPSGQGTEALNKLLHGLSKIGLHIVEVGQLESFDKTIGAHGPDWVNEAIKKDLARDQGFEYARTFVKELIN
jgi:hypothetical protein